VPEAIVMGGTLPQGGWQQCVAGQCEVAASISAGPLWGMVRRKRQRTLAPAPTPTLLPSPTPTPSPAPTRSEVIARAKASVVKVVTPNGYGSGFFVSAEGLVVTANHVVSDAASITVVSADGVSYPASLKGRDLWRDIAVLDIATATEDWLSISNRTLQLGEEFIKIGFGGTPENASVNIGVVSAILPAVRMRPTQAQTDTAINPGDSGAPLIDNQGLVLVVATTKYVGQAVEGVAFGSLLDGGMDWLSGLRAGDDVCSPLPSFSQQKYATRNATYRYRVDLPSSFEFVVNSFLETGSLYSWRVAFGRKWIPSSPFPDKLFAAVYSPWIAVDGPGRMEGSSVN